MRVRVLVRILVLVALGLLACGRRPRTRCEQLCRIESRCADELDVAGDDYTECVERCGALDRDSRGHPLVEAHLKCLIAASTCRAVLDCP